MLLLKADYLQLMFIYRDGVLLPCGKEEDDNNYAFDIFVNAGDFLGCFGGL